MKLQKKCQKRVRKDIVKNKKGISGRPFWEERFLGMLDLCGFAVPGNCFWGNGIWDAGMTAFDGFGFWGLFLGKKKGCRNDKKELQGTLPEAEDEKV